MGIYTARSGVAFPEPCGKVIDTKKKSVYNVIEEI